MAQSYNIDTSVNINGGLTVNGDISIPSNTITANTVNATSLSGNGSLITNLSSSAMTDVLKLDGTRTMTGPLYIDTSQGYSMTLDSNNLTFSRVNAPSYIRNQASGGTLTLQVNGTNNALIIDASGNSSFYGNITATGKTMTSLYINATSSLQENGTNLSSKYALQTTSISAGTGLSGGGSLSTSRTLSVNFGGNGSASTVSRSDHNHDLSYVNITGGTVGTSYFGDSTNGYIRLTAGGLGSYVQAVDKNKSGNTTLYLTGMNGTATTVRTSNNIIDDSSGNATISGTISEGGTLLSSKYSSSSRKISTGSGLSGGGDLTADRTLSVVFGGNGSALTVSHSDHDHNGTYLALTGGTITGALTSNGQIVVNQYNAGFQFALGAFNNSVSGSQWWHGPNGSGDNILQIIKGGSGNSNYRFLINGTDTIWTSGNDGANSGLDADTIDTIQGSSLVRNDVTNQSVQSGFTTLGTSYAGSSTSSGAIVIRTGTGQSGIQLAGDNATQLANVKSYINASGNASFSGTVSVNNLTITSTSKVANLNAEMINGVQESDIAKNTSVLELGGKGVYTGLNVTAQTTPNMSVVVNSGTVYTDSGMRVAIPTETIALATASNTYGRIDAIYVQGSSAGANEGKATVITGTPASTPVAPSVPSDGVELAQIFVSQNIGAIQSNAITDKRLWKPMYFDGTTLSFRNQLDIYSGITSTTRSVVEVDKPIMCTPSNTSLTFNSGANSLTWTHNLNIANYTVRLSCNSPEPHIYWSNKTANAITINLDDTFSDTIIVDVSLEAY